MIVAAHQMIPTHAADDPRILELAFSELLDQLADTAEHLEAAARGEIECGWLDQPSYVHGDPRFPQNMILVTATFTPEET